VERIGGDYGGGEVQAVQQRPEPGDLVGGVVDVGLGEDRVGGVVHRGEQVDLGLVWWPLPRRVLPSTATTRRHAARGCRWRPGGRWGGCWSVSHRPMTRSNASGSTRADLTP
jgi:hypothetical protein